MTQTGVSNQGMSVADAERDIIGGRAGNTKNLQDVMIMMARSGIFRTNAGNPNGTLTPGSIGENCLDTTNLIWYRAAGTTTTSWETDGGAPMAAFNSNAATSSATVTAAQITGGEATVDLAMTGTLGAGGALTLPTAAAVIAVLRNQVVGTAYRLRIINRSSANFAWTVTTNTGWTLTGTMTIAQNTWRDFVVVLATASTLTLQAVGTGTDS